MSTAYLDITPELLTELCKSFHEGDVVRLLSVTDNGLPHDTECVGSSVVAHGQAVKDHDCLPHRGDNPPSYVRLHLQSDSFKDGELLPRVSFASHDVLRMTVNEVRKLYGLPEVENADCAIKDLGAVHA